MPSKENANISFIEHFAPALQAGTYKVELKTQFENPGILPNLFAEKKEWIFVGGERFNLKPADIDSVYPPANGLGTFEDTLPHIVFTKTGLPWERELAPDDYAPAVKLSGRSSWLALFLFQEKDPAPTPQTMQIQDLMAERTPEGIWFPSDFQPEPDETPETPCTVIDIPRALFEAIKPSSLDLTWLAHARRVSLAGKIGHAHKDNPGEHEYSVVIGNRLPRVGEESQVHLVSLESFLPILEAPVPESYHSVRLVSLKNWRFKCRDTGGSFLDHVRNLSPIKALTPGTKNDAEHKWQSVSTTKQATTDQPLFLHFPFVRNQGPLKKVFTYLQSGFLPMEHKFRQGLTSISWYRSPLTPVEVDSLIQPPALSADALLIYDADTGYYDVSYAAAWQLGQLLGLRNKQFARALFFWKQQTRIDHRKDMERALLQKKLPLLKPNEDGVLVLPEFPAQAPGDSVAFQPTSGLMDDGLKEGTYNPSKTGELYRTVASYIEDLKSLRDVPYNYLVPDPKMLPEESIRFFHLDPNWIDALFDGAMSLGDLVTEEAIKERVILKSSTQRANNKETHPLYTGFLLRSSLLKIWPGLEFRLTGDAKGFVRLDRIGEEVVMGIVEGKLTGIELREPPEGLHFGVHDPQLQSDGSLTFSKKIRKPLPEEGNVMNSNWQTTPYGVINFSEWVSEMVRRRVLRFAPTESGDVQEKFFHPLIEAFGPFSTADFGYVMVEPVQSALITTKSSQKKTPTA
jgi:hypothetical protein